MKTQVFLVFVFASVVLSFTPVDDPHVYCGRRLAQMLDLLCGDDYLVKKSAPSYNSVNYDGFPWQWLGHHKARAMASARGKRGVADECCEKPCTVDELLTYC